MREAFKKKKKKKKAGQHSPIKILRGGSPEALLPKSWLPERRCPLLPVPGSIM